MTHSLSCPEIYRRRSGLPPDICIYALRLPDGSIPLSDLQQGNVFLYRDRVDIIPQGIPVDLIPADKIIGV